MTHEDLFKVQRALIIDVERIIATKGKEYAHDKDALANFKRIGEELKLGPLMIWYVYTKKHLDAVISYINEGRSLSTEGIRGRFVDLIAYLILGYAIVQELNTPIRESKTIEYSSEREITEQERRILRDTERTLGDDFKIGGSYER